PPGRRGRHARPDETDEDRAPVEDVLSLEQPYVTVEPSDHRGVELPGPAAVRPVDPPALRVGVEEPEPHPREPPPVGRAENGFVAVPVEDRVRLARRLELLPLVRACEPPAKPAV